MDNEMKVSFSVNKTGVYVQFVFPVASRELGELEAYDKAIRAQVKAEFRSLFEQYNMEFATETCYVVTDMNGTGQSLVICLLGSESPELVKKLEALGLPREDF